MPAGGGAPGAPGAIPGLPSGPLDPHLYEVSVSGFHPRHPISNICGGRQLAPGTETFWQSAVSDEPAVESWVQIQPRVDLGVELTGVDLLCGVVGDIQTTCTLAVNIRSRDGWWRDEPGFTVRPDGPDAQSFAIAAGQLRPGDREVRIALPRQHTTTNALRVWHIVPHGRSGGPAPEPPPPPPLAEVAVPSPALLQGMLADRDAAIAELRRELHERAEQSSQQRQQQQELARVKHQLQQSRQEVENLSRQLSVSSAAYKRKVDIITQQYNEQGDKQAEQLRNYAFLEGQMEKVTEEMEQVRQERDQVRRALDDLLAAQDAMRDPDLPPEIRPSVERIYAVMRENDGLTVTNRELTAKYEDLRERLWQLRDSVACFRDDLEEACKEHPRSTGVTFAPTGMGEPDGAPRERPKRRASRRQRGPGRPAEADPQEHEPWAQAAPQGPAGGGAAVMRGPGGGGPEGRSPSPLRSPTSDDAAYDWAPPAGGSRQPPPDGGTAPAHWKAAAHGGPGEQPQRWHPEMGPPPPGHPAWGPSGVPPPEATMESPRSPDHGYTSGDGEGGGAAAARGGLRVDLVCPLTSFRYPKMKRAQREALQALWSGEYPDGSGPLLEAWHERVQAAVRGGTPIPAPPAWNRPVAQGDPAGGAPAPAARDVAPVPLWADAPSGGKASWSPHGGKASWSPRGGKASCSPRGGKTSWSS